MPLQKFDALFDLANFFCEILTAGFCSSSFQLFDATLLIICYTRSVILNFDATLQFINGFCNIYGRIFPQTNFVQGLVLSQIY